MPYTPSVQDRSGEILAQGISQGFSSLTQGVERYYKKKEEKEILDSTVSSLMSRASTSPKLANYLGVNMSDEQAVRAGIKAAGGGDAMAGARMLRQSLQQFGEFERQDKEREDDNAAFGIGYEAFSGGKDPHAAIAQAGGKMSIRVAKTFSDLLGARALEEERRRTPAPKLPEIKSIKETGADGRSYDVTYQYNPDGTRAEVARQETGVASGYDRGGPGGTLAPIAGSPQDPNTKGTPANIAVSAAALAARKEDREVKQEDLVKKKFFAAAETAKSELEATLATVEKAQALSKSGIGGQIGGRIGYFGDKNEQLQSYLDSIKSNLALTKMAELKSLSPTGSTGFGNQSDKELAILQERFGTLKSTKNEKVTQETLEEIKRVINNRLTSFNPSSVFENNDALLKEFGL